MKASESLGFVAVIIATFAIAIGMVWITMDTFGYPWDPVTGYQVTTINIRTGEITVKLYSLDGVEAQP